jgi:hypothetical protein
MANGRYFRGGNSMSPRPIDYRIDPRTGLVSTSRGVSVFDLPDGLDRFGGPHLLTQVPESLRIIQVGRNPHHYEVVPAVSMTLAEYQRELARIVLVPVT